jgi:hypothetical protein
MTAYLAVGLWISNAKAAIGPGTTIREELQEYMAGLTGHYATISGLISYLILLQSSSQHLRVIIPLLSYIFYKLLILVQNPLNYIIIGLYVRDSETSYQILGIMRYQVHLCSKLFRR